jgi:hypothetical protein
MKFRKTQTLLVIMNKPLKKLLFMLSLGTSVMVSQGLFAGCGDKPCCDKEAKTDQCKDKEAKKDAAGPEHHAE